MDSYNQVILLRTPKLPCKLVEPHQRVKRHHYKVRSGCKICRGRRVKCDETKPICTRCSKLSLSCIYDRDKTFTPPNRAATVRIYAKEIQTPSGRLNSLPGNSDEQRSLTYYLQSYRSRFENSVAWLPIINVTIVYLNFIPQIAQSSPTVRCAISASASAEEHLLLQEDTPDWVIRRQRHCFKSTVEAILSNDLQVEELLMCCLLLLAYSCFTSDHKAVEVHFRSGLRIIEERKKFSRASFLDDTENALKDLEKALTSIYEGKCPVPIQESHPHAATRAGAVGCV